VTENEKHKKGHKMSVNPGWNYSRSQVPRARKTAHTQAKSESVKPRKNLPHPTPQRQTPPQQVREKRGSTVSTIYTTSAN